MPRPAPHPFALRQRGVAPAQRDEHGRLVISRSAGAAGVEYVTLVDGSPALGLEPLELPFALDYRSIAADAAVRLDAHAIQRRRGDELVWESPRVPVLLRAYAAAVDSFWRLLGAASTPARLAASTGIELSDVLGCVELAACAGVVVLEGQAPHCVDLWSTHEAWFHARQRLGRADGPIGGTYPHRGRWPAPPARREPHAGDRIALPSTALRESCSLSRALESRRSRRERGEDPLNIERVGSLLYHSARATEVDLARTPDEYDVRRHLYPTGGGMGEIELYLSVHRCDGLRPGFYHYDPVDHCVTHLAAAAVLDIEKLGIAASRAVGRRGPHDLVLLFAARIIRSLWKYEAIAYSMAMRDVGALTQTLYLVSCALGLASCAIGKGDAALFARLAGTDPWTEPLVGELAING